MRRRVRRGFGLAVLVCGTALSSACSCGDDEGGSASNDNVGGSGGSAADGGINLDGSGGAICAGGCPEDQICINGFCVTQTDCTDDDDCQNDTYCEPSAGCVPWGAGDFDPNCQTGGPPGNFAPTIKCAFTAPPAGDPFPDHRDVQSTPVVVNFNVGGTGVPSVVAPFTATVVSSYTENLGVVRVLRGDNCELEANLGYGQAGYAGPMMSSSSLSAGDLDGDGSAEIVATAADSTLVAFTRKAGVWSTLWVSAAAIAGGGWAGSSIHDIDDDGVPEVIKEATVVDGATGAIKGASPAGYASYSSGLNPVLANLDQDPAAELTNGAAIWEWSAAGWTQDPIFPATGTPGFAAVADFGAYGASLPATNPEIANVQGGTATIYAVDGTVVLGPIAIPGGGGGAPTIADYDGDGLTELGVAGQAFLTVFDIDCTASPRPGGTCVNTTSCDDSAGAPGACPSGILWSRRTQDISSNITGSSVFDFEDDGKAEVVYADECFVRVYDGTDGRVLFSQFTSSCTWYENPVVADTDGNFRADLVAPSNLACSDGVNGIACTMLDADGVDSKFAGAGCLENKDCASNICDSGFCRCTASAECCGAGTDAACESAGLKCAPPPAGTPGAGNTCRANHPTGVQGIRIYQDATDRWVRSRTIWNQHAYAVTHVEESGVVPTTSAWKPNWLEPELNNFRQNVPGNGEGQDVPDMTAGVAGFVCVGGTAELHAPVCNRGSAPIAAGVKVGFYDGSTLVCSTQTSKALQPGECEDVSCAWTTPPKGNTGVDITVIADDGGEKMECKEGNNQGTIFGVKCSGVT